MGPRELLLIRELATSVGYANGASRNDSTSCSRETNHARNSSNDYSEKTVSLRICFYYFRVIDPVILTNGE